MAIVEREHATVQSVMVYVLEDDATDEYLGVRVKGGDGKHVSVVLEGPARAELNRGGGARRKDDPDLDIELPVRLPKKPLGARGRPFGISVSVT